MLCRELDSALLQAEISATWSAPNSGALPAAHRNAPYLIIHGASRRALEALKPVSSGAGLSPLQPRGCQMMDDDLIALADRLSEMAHNTGTLNCLGCGYEHRCGLHGCAVLKRAADIIRCVSLIFRYM